MITCSYSDAEDCSECLEPVCRRTGADCFHTDMETQEDEEV